MLGTSFRVLESTQAALWRWLQARHCYTRYNEYHRCVAQKGEGADECRVFQRAYRSLCPSEWLERWNEQREEGTWPGRY